MASMIINGATYVIPDGASVSIVNGFVKINNIEVDTYPQSAQLIVRINGDVGNVEASGSVTVSGSAKGAVQAGGSVNCNDVDGNVTAGGSVRCGKVSGSVQAGGSVRM